MPCRGEGQSRLLRSTCLVSRPPVDAADVELVARMARGDRLALAALYERHAAKLRGDADTYVKDALSSLSLTLQKLSATFEHGRDTMHTRRSSVADGYEQERRRR